MVRDIQEVKESASRFMAYASRYLPVKKVLLYGSYAKGNPRSDSDIDIAVFVDLPEHKKRLEIATKLFHYAGDIDVDIEPKCFFWDEYLNHEQGSILSEIINTAVEVN
jgi:predicted nucleotidyltransferase